MPYYVGMREVAGKGNRSRRQRDRSGTPTQLPPSEDERIVHLLRSMLSTWDSLSEAQRKDALRKALYIADR